MREQQEGPRKYLLAGCLFMVVPIFMAVLSYVRGASLDELLRFSPLLLVVFCLGAVLLFVFRDMMARGHNQPTNSMPQRYVGIVVSYLFASFGALLVYMPYWAEYLVSTPPKWVAGALIGTGLLFMAIGIPLLVLVFYNKLSKVDPELGHRRMARLQAFTGFAVGILVLVSGFVGGILTWIFIEGPIGPIFTFGYLGVAGFFYGVYYLVTLDERKKKRRNKWKSR